MSASQRELAALEGCPGDDQKDRLEGFLAELMLITRKYQILLVDDHETLQVQDLLSDTLIGVGLVGFTAAGDQDKILCYVPADSILDGVWLVDTADGPREQHAVGRVFPQRSRE